ncbi:hypothetical protein BJV78DRAFT_1353883 [Lactifluus subvellereus]|nr:hypothetical protein BJV78DRAFT_1353883 [Lactifluus subvellereus]
MARSRQRPIFGERGQKKEHMETFGVAWVVTTTVDDNCVRIPQIQSRRRQNGSAKRKCYEDINRCLSRDVRSNKLSGRCGPPGRKSTSQVTRGWWWKPASPVCQPSIPTTRTATTFVQEKVQTLLRHVITSVASKTNPPNYQKQRDLHIDFVLEESEVQPLAHAAAYQRPGRQDRNEREQRACARLGAPGDMADSAGGDAWLKVHEKDVKEYEKNEPERKQADNDRQTGTEKQGLMGGGDKGQVMLRHCSSVVLMKIKPVDVDEEAGHGEEVGGVPDAPHIHVWGEEEPVGDDLDDELPHEGVATESTTIPRRH